MSSYSVPGPSPETEAQRRATLRRHKIFVTALLGIAAVIFFVCAWYQSTHPDAPNWIGYVRAAAEAGMVGGLADWFAVTALFKHPLGIPIPHTALVPKKKDQVGQALSEFVGENFLNAQLITEKVAAANVPEKIAAWISEPENAQIVSREAGRFTANAVRALDDETAETFIKTQLIDKFAEPNWAPPAGRVLESLINDGKVDPVVDDLIEWGYRKVLTMEDTVVELIDERMPGWAPRFARNLVGEKVYAELVGWSREVYTDKNHEARQSIRRNLVQFAHDLQHDPAMVDRIESLKADLMGSTQVQGAAHGLWKTAQASIAGAAEDEESFMRRKIEELCLEWGHNLRTDEQLRASLESRIMKVVAFIADNYAGDVTDIISETIERWDAEETSEKIELMVGKDLQFIRLNGTIVGALAGLVIYSVADLLF